MAREEASPPEGNSFTRFFERVDRVLEPVFGDPPMAADVDGEVRLRTPIRLRVVPNGVRVMVPAEFEDR